MNPTGPGPRPSTRPSIGWSWTVGSAFGVKVRIHATFLLLLIWIVASTTAGGGDPMSALRTVGTTLALFGIVVMHEFGHVLTARRYGIVTRDITLLPIGGVATMERMPEDPRQECLVAIAGPAVNVVLAILFAVLATALGRSLSPELLVEHPDWVGQLFWANVVLAVFNLVPAFPMDGGRVLRALLAMRMGADRATAIAARFGQALALVFGFVGLFSSPMLVFVALFVWTGAAAEASAVHIRSAITGLRARDVMAGPALTLHVDEPLAVAVEAAEHGFQSEFPVLGGDGRVVGWIGLRELIGGLATGGVAPPIRAVMREHACTVAPDEPLEVVLERMQSSESRAAAVVASGRVVGVLTLEHLGEFVAIEDARGIRARRP